MLVGSTWPGWATVESEPAIFDQLLQKIGVRGMTVEEVYSLDETTLSSLPSIHGLVFLFRWKEEPDSTAAENICPTDIWFANQVVDNACASLALLNIVLNIKDADIGDKLRAFKEFTKDFTPALRGLTLTNFDYLRKLHNTFARKSEMLESDLALMEAMKSKGKRKYKRDEEEDSFHFIGYIYKLGHLWELDGLKKAPVRLARCESHNWTTFAAPQIMLRMEKYAADEIRFNLLALCKDPVDDLKTRLQEKEEELELEMTEDVANQQVVETIQQEIESIKISLEERFRKSASYQDYVERRRHDYTEFTTCMLEILHEKGVLQQMLG